MTRSAIWASRAVSSSPRMKAASSSMGRAATSAMFRPPTVTARLVGFSLAPWQASHGTSRM